MHRARHIALALIASLVLVLAPAHAQPHPAPAAQGEQQSVADFTAKFLKSFENLDLDAFIACFAADASVFFPTPEPPHRFDGKAAIREHFAEVFSAIRKGSHATAPPYQQLPPQRLDIKLLSKDAALVTFELENDQRIARRTLVLARSRDGWRIEHLHASNIAVQPL